MSKLRVALWSLFACAVALLIAFLVFVRILRDQRGDYLTDERELTGFVLRMDSLPRWAEGLMAPPGGHDYYTAGPGVLTLWSRHDPSAMMRSSIGAHPSAGTRPTSPLLTSVSLIPRPGEEHRYEIRSAGYRHWGDWCEWFPPESLGEFARSSFLGSPGGPADLVRLARQLHTELPERLTTRYWLIASLYRAGEVAEADGLLRDWRGDFEDSHNPRASWLLYLLENDQLAASPEAEARRRAFDDAIPLAGGGSTATLDEFHRWIDRFRGENVPRHFSLRGSLPNYYSIGWLARCARVRAAFLMMEGRREEAHRLLLGTTAFLAGTSSPMPGFIMRGLVSQRPTAYEAAIDLFVRGEATADWLEIVWSDWEQLWETLPALDSELMCRSLDPETDSLAAVRALANSGRHGRSEALAAVLEFVLVVEARRELFREGLRARHYLAATGSWPAIDGDHLATGLLLWSDRVPVDPFEDPPRGLRARVAGDTLILWSVGPDLFDDRGAIEYDPINGMSSGGDVLLSIDRDPLYRFPADEGHVYADRAEFNARYPEGPPRDPFTFAPVYALQLTTDGSDLVWSYGPDSDSFNHDDKLLFGQQVDLMYDPTNGIQSRGDLFMKLKFAPDSP